MYLVFFSNNQFVYQPGLLIQSYLVLVAIVSLPDRQTFYPAQVDLWQCSSQRSPQRIILQANKDAENAEERGENGIDPNNVDAEKTKADLEASFSVLRNTL